MRIKNEWEDIRKGKALGCSVGSVVRARVELLASILGGSQLPVTPAPGELDPGDPTPLTSKSFPLLPVPRQLLKALFMVGSLLGLYACASIATHRLVTALPLLCYPRYSDYTMWTAFLGLLDQSKRSASGVQELKLKRIISHPSFNDFTFDYDIALLELEKPVEYSTVVRPICLPDATHVFPAGKAIWVTGWGHTQEGGELQAGPGPAENHRLTLKVTVLVHLQPFCCLGCTESILASGLVDYSMSQCPAG